MLRIAICDDDPIFLDDFENTLNKSFENAGQQIIIFKFSFGKSLIEKVEKEKQIFDIIVLDVDMPKISGFQVAQRLRELNAAFILLFTTYIERQSREGYFYGAFRYIFKNNLQAEISEAVTSIMNKIGASDAGEENVMLKYRNSGVLEDLLLKKTDIILLKMEKTRRVTLKSVYSEYELIVKPLTEYVEILKPPTFNLILRNYILNFNHIECVKNGFFVLTGGLKVPLGIKREARKASMEKYLKFLEERL